MSLMRIVLLDTLDTLEKTELDMFASNEDFRSKIISHEIIRTQINEVEKLLYKLEANNDSL